MPDLAAGHHLVLPLRLGDDGKRVAIKDVIDVAGVPTRAGSRAFTDRPPAERHADVVQRLLERGCRIVGKANLHELAFGMTGLNAWTGTPVNPRFPGLVPGGSSSGSATAVAAGLVDFALGTDTGGSIRVPAACCGIAGMKPTYGRLSRQGLTPAESSLDCVGPLAPDAAGLVEAMAMLDPGFESATMPRAPRIGLVATEAVSVVTEGVVDALRRAGCELVERSLPGQAAAFAAAMTVMNSEMHASFRHLIPTGALGGDIEARLRRAAAITSADVAAAEEVRAAFRQEVDRALEDVDALAMPTLPAFPVPLDEAGDAAAALAMSRLARPFNLSGHPALSLPVAAVEEGPISLQLVGPMDGDAALCAAAAWIERRLRQSSPDAVSATLA